MIYVLCDQDWMEEHTAQISLGHSNDVIFYYTEGKIFLLGQNICMILGITIHVLNAICCSVLTRPAGLTSSIWSPSLQLLFFPLPLPKPSQMAEALVVFLCSSGYFLTQPRGPMISEISEGLSECLCPEVISFHPCSCSYNLHTAQFCTI